MAMQFLALPLPPPGKRLCAVAWSELDVVGTQKLHVEIEVLDGGVDVQKSAHHGPESELRAEAVAVAAEGAPLAEGHSGVRVRAGGHVHDSGNASIVTTTYRLVIAVRKFRL